MFNPLLMSFLQTSHVNYFNYFQVQAIRSFFEPASAVQWQGRTRMAPRCREIDICASFDDEDTDDHSDYAVSWSALETRLRLFRTFPSPFGQGEPRVLWFVRLMFRNKAVSISRKSVDLVRAVIKLQMFMQIRIFIR